MTYREHSGRITHARSSGVVQGVYIIDGELSIILGEAFDYYAPTRSKVDDNLLYIDEVKINGFKVKDSSGNLLKEYNFNSFINTQYKSKTLNGKSYGALVINNYGNFGDLKRIGYSTKTANTFFAHGSKEEFFAFDDALRALFTFNANQDEIFTNLYEGYIIENNKLSIIFGDSYYGNSCQPHLNEDFCFKIDGRPASIKCYNNYLDVLVYYDNHNAWFEFGKMYFPDLPQSIKLEYSHKTNIGKFTCVTINGQASISDLKRYKYKTFLFYDDPSINSVIRRFFDRFKKFFTHTGGV